MKKLITLFITVTMSLTMFAQPYFYGDKTNPCPSFEEQLETYNKKLEETKRVHNLLNKTLPVKTIIKTIPQPTKMDTTIVNLNVNNYLTSESSYSDLYKIMSRQQEALEALKADLYKDKNQDIVVFTDKNRNGWLKILGGTLSEAIGVGIIAYTNIPRYSFSESKAVYNIEYYYQEYELVPTYNAFTELGKGEGIVSRCEPHHKPTPTPEPAPEPTPSEPITINNDNNQTQTQTQTVIINNTIVQYNPVEYNLRAIDKIGVISYTDKSQTITKMKVNKSGYYIGGAFIAAGIVLDIWGISDLIHVTNNGIGIVKTF